MAASDAKPLPVKGQAYRVTFPIFDADGDLVADATGLDSEISPDGAAFADCVNEAKQIPVSSGMYYLDITAPEMDYDTVSIKVKTTTSGAKTTPLVLYPVEDGDLPVKVTVMDSGVVTADAIATDALTSDEFATSALNEIADAVLTRDWSSVAGVAARSALNALRFLRNKVGLSGSTMTIYEEDDTTTAWTATVTTDSGADPITTVDPT